jgi:hypothetical protein
MTERSMKIRFKKGDKIYFDGPFKRALWKVLEVLPKDALYKLKETDKKEVFFEPIQSTDRIFAPMSEIPGPWKKYELAPEKLLKSGFLSKFPSTWKKK